MLCLCFVALALLQLGSCETVPPTLAWSDRCDSGHDFCATLDFCGSGEQFGYVLPGTQCAAGPGPILRLAQGKKYMLTLANKADVVTNLHTHGLHVSGSGNSDDVTREVSPGNCIKYTWDIVDDHPGGTFWYHPHQHGMAATQVNAGAYGLLIVEDEDATTHLSEGIELWQRNERVLQITGIERNCTYRRDGDGDCFPARRHDGERLDPSIPSAKGNGVLNDEFNFIANEWYRLRVSIVDADGHAKQLRFGIGCTAHLVARDGIWRSSVPAQPAATYELPGSARADFAVRCPEPGDSAAVEFDGDVVATIKVRAGTRTAATPYLNSKPWHPQRSGFLADTLAAAVPAENMYVLNTTNTEINGLRWDSRVPHRTIAFDEVHEWTLLQTHHHPFHLHVYHMQVASPAGCGDHEYGEWYDTIAAMGPCVVRFRTADMGERVVFHCHVLAHEDGGAMGWVDVQGPGMRKNLGGHKEELCAVTPQY